MPKWSLYRRKKTVECKTCGTGKYSPDNVSPCTQCHLYNIRIYINDEYSCKSCPQNTSQRWYGASSCSQCEHGQNYTFCRATECVCNSGNPKKFGCSCDIPDCTAGKVWSNVVCQEDDDTFYYTRSHDTSHHCASTVHDYIDPSCTASSKRECQSIPPLDDNKVSIRCVWKSKIETEKESLAKCSKTKCPGLLHKQEIAEIQYEEFDDLSTSHFYNKSFDGECIRHGNWFLVVMVIMRFT